MYEQFIRDRIKELSEQAELSDRKLSHMLGHSDSYIRGIVSGRSLPRMSEFLYMCEVLHITPEEFFKEKIELSQDKRKAISIIRNMKDEDISVVLAMLEKIK